MILTSDMLIQVRNILSSDRVIDAWSQEHYGRSLAVYLGFDDDKDAIESTGYPLVEIYSATRVRGADKHRDVWDLEISVQVENETREVISNGITYTGFVHAEELRDMVENALYRSRIANVDSTGASGNFSNFPLFEAVTKIRITMIADARSGISKRL